MKEDKKELSPEQLKLEEQKRYANRGKVAGYTTAGIGAVALGVGKLALKSLKNLFVKKNGEVKNSWRYNPDNLKKLKYGGTAALVGGLGLAGYSHYKHHKLKKAEKNDSTKD